MRDWVSSMPFTCEACGGLVPRYVWFEKEAYKQQLLFPEAECQCPWHKRLQERLEQLFYPSRSESLAKFRWLIDREGMSIDTD